jgi:hypothetical protein
MPVWKILFILLFGIVCLAFALATIVVPMTLVVDNTRWFWLAGLLTTSIGLFSLFRIFLNNADRALDKVRR